MTVDVTAVHDHQHGGEDWRLRAGLSDAEKALARMVRPILQSLKHHLILLGTTALAAGDPPRVGAVATALNRQLAGWHRDLACAQNDGRVEPVRRALSDATTEMQAWASAIDHEGHVSSHAASGLRSAYRRFRGAAGILWHSELIPEAHTPGGRGAQHG